MKRRERARLDVRTYADEDHDWWVGSDLTPGLDGAGQRVTTDHVLGMTDNVLRFFEDVFEEVLELFPSKFIHVGGDECPKAEWRRTPAAQERMKKEGLKNEDELQSWFIRHFDSWLAKRGRRLVGWDEILEGGLAPGATVMSWRGEKGGIPVGEHRPPGPPSRAGKGQGMGRPVSQQLSRQRNREHRPGHVGPPDVHVVHDPDEARHQCRGRR